MQQNLSTRRRLGGWGLEGESRKLLREKAKTVNIME